jgi:glycine C-acetyltransferase
MTPTKKDSKLVDILRQQLKEIQEAGTYKKERIITSPQSSAIKVSTGQEVLNFWYGI